MFWTRKKRERESKDLTREIRKVKRESFPELKWLYVRGFYVPDKQLRDCEAIVSTRYSLIRLKRGQKILASAGILRMEFPLSSSCPSNSFARQGAIAHELSHFVLPLPEKKGRIHLDEEVEQLANVEVVKRGYYDHAMSFLQGSYDLAPFNSFNYHVKDLNTALKSQEFP